MLLVLSRGALAQPSDAQIKKDLTSPGVLSVTLSKTGGGKVWSKLDLQYYWERSAVVVRNAGLKEFPNVKLEIGGIARYTIIGGGYKFKKFLVTYNSYQGIPNPTKKEIETMLRGDVERAVTNHTFNRIIGDVEKLELAADPQWEWHTPNSVSFKVRAVFEEIVNNTDTEKVDRLYEIRLYRDAINKPWKEDFHSRDRESKVLGKRTHKADDLAAMKTLGYVTLENKARADLAKLPRVEVPVFNSPVELARFTHQMLLSGDKGKFEAFITKAAGPGMQDPRSDILFTSNGLNAFNKAVEMAFEGKGKYKDQYCPDPKVDTHGDDHIEWVNKTGDRSTRLRTIKTGETYKNGEKTGGQYKIADLEVWVMQKPEDIERLASYEPGKLCNPAPNEITLANLGAAIQATKNVEAAKENLVATSKAIEWKPLNNPAARLSINFPGEAQLTEGKMNDKYPMFTYETKHDTGLYRAIAIVYPVKLNRAQAQNSVRSAIQGVADANGARITSNSERTEGTYSMVTTLEKEGARIQMRAFAFGDTLYQLIYSTAPTSYLVENEKAFFDSFKPVAP
jgi:hypothetical protein